VTVLDTSGAIDFLLGGPAATRVSGLVAEAPVAAPDLLVYETLAVLRRHTLAGTLTEARAGGAVTDLGDLPLELFPTLALRRRAWELRHNFTAADALFVALAEQLDEPLATGDTRLRQAALIHTRVDIIDLAVG
jgi:predicted nucleic acid-binding protein